MKITLPKPVKLGEMTFAELTIREEVLVSDLIAAGDAPNDIARTFWLLASLADVPRTVIERQPMSWGLEMDAKLAGLAASASGNEPADGGTSSPSSATS